MNRRKKAGVRYQALLQLLRASESVWNASRLFFARWRLTPSQFNVLNLLYGERRGCSQTELSRQLIMHRSNATGLIDRLERLRLVRRLATPGDRRTYRLVLTPAGRHLVQNILPAYHRLANDAWGRLPVTSAKRLHHDLSRLGQNISRIESNLSSSR